MKNQALAADPFNLIITGVGGQGNVLASKLIGNMLVDKGYYVTIGETFGASQRGGSVMSHLRISSESILSPQIPRGKAHAVVALEPTEAIRVLQEYGNPDGQSHHQHPPCIFAGRDLRRSRLPRRGGSPWLDAKTDPVPTGSSMPRTKR